MFDEERPTHLLMNKGRFFVMPNACELARWGLLTDGRSLWGLLELVPIIRLDVKSASNLANMLDSMRIHVKSTSNSTNMLHFGGICEN